MISADGDRWWVVTEFTFDSRREIGSTSALRREWEKRFDTNPLDQIDELRLHLLRLIAERNYCIECNAAPAESCAESCSSTDRVETARRTIEGMSDG